MMLLVLKERLKSFYGKYAVLVGGVIRFLYSFTALWILNVNIGYMAALKEPYVTPALSLLCAFLPYSVISFVLALVMVAHLYAVSAEIALVTAVLLILVILLYYGFQPGDSYWLVLMPVAFFLKIPFVIPILAGLSGRLLSFIPVGCGTMIYYILLYVKQNAGPLTNDASVDITQKFVQIIRAIMSNKAMVVMLLACFVGILVVYMIRSLSVDYAWVIAIVSGIVAQLAMVFVGDYLFDVTVPIVELIAGVAVSAAIAGIYHFMVFAVDYTRTEYTQFEDDDYVYYVKAVPKIVVSKPDVRVQRINNPGRARRGAKEASGARAK